MGVLLLDLGLWVLEAFGCLGFGVLGFCGGAFLKSTLFPNVRLLGFIDLGNWGLRGRRRMGLELREQRLLGHLSEGFRRG